MADIDAMQGLTNRARSEASARSGSEPLASALDGLRRGELSVRLKARDGLSVEVAEAFNALAAHLDKAALDAPVLREQQETLQRVNEELEEKATLLALASRYKSEFLANMSHELRTPLNSLLILAKMLAENKDANLTGKQVEYARTIHSAGTDLLELINDVLDLSKVEAGKIEVHAHDVRLQELLADLEQTFRPVAQQKGLSLALDVDPAVPATLRTDGQRLEQILRNLIGNAFKFTAQGGVTVRVGRPPPGFTSQQASLMAVAPNDVIAFSVSDTGIGIAEDKRQLIFEAFRQADGTTSRKYGGTGLGLSISRELARLLGGEVRVESETGKGSTFTIFLPCEDGPEPAPTSREKPGETPPATRGADALLVGKTVLIVDADVRNIYALATVLEDAGMRVVFAENGRDGVDVLRTTPEVAVVLMDLMMPDTDGYETMRRVRELPEFRALPILALTAKTMQSDAEKCLAVGASASVTKPVHADQLLPILRAWLDPSRT